MFTPSPISDQLDRYYQLSALATSPPHNLTVAADRSVVGGARRRGVLLVVAAVAGPLVLASPTAALPGSLTGTSEAIPRSSPDRSLRWTLPKSQVGAVSPRVTVVGDSLTVAMAPSIRRELQALGFRVAAIDAEVGRTTPAGVARLRSLPLGDVVVVGLGTNDVAGGGDPRQFSRHVERALAAAGPRPVVWVNVALRRTPAEARRSAAFNQALERLGEEHPNLVVVDWATVSARRPQWLRADGVHLTAEGSTARARVVAATVAALEQGS
jgi:hypothetical protein